MSRELCTIGGAPIDGLDLLFGSMMIGGLFFAAGVRFSNRNFDRNLGPVYLGGAKKARVSLGIAAASLIAELIHRLV